MPKFVIEREIPGAGSLSALVYIAPNEEMVQEHARMGGFPANSVSKVLRIIDPTTAESLPG